MKLLEFLKQGKVVSDKDYLNDSDYIFVFSEKVKYKIEGFSHGINSHAIKHLIEFDKPFVDSIINDIKKLLIAYNGDIFINYRGQKDQNLEKVEDITKMFNNRSLLDTLDYINDKEFNNEKMIDIEKKLLIIVHKIGNKYLEFVEKRIKTDAIKLENCISKMDNKAYTLYIFDNGLIITFENTFRTAFSMNIKKMYNFIENRYILTNQTENILLKIQKTGKL